ncbi:Kelch-like protein 12 [Sparganum proliferum]
MLSFNQGDIGATVQKCLKDNVILNVHRLVLAARIPSLYQQLTAHPTRRNSFLYWPLIAPIFASTFIRYVYTGELKVCESTAVGLILLAREVSLLRVETWITTENLANNWDFANSMTVEPLKTACLQHMKVYFETTVATDLFLRLPADQLLTLLQADDLQVDSEEKAFQAIVRWVSPEGKRDGDRAEYLPQLLRETNLLGHTEVDLPGFNKNCRTNGKLLDTRRLLVEKKVPRARAYEALFRCAKHHNQNSVFSIGGWIEGQGVSSRVDVFDTKERRWKLQAPLIIRRQQHAATLVTVGDPLKDDSETLILVCGGGYNQPADCGGDWQLLRACEIFDPLRCRWHILPSMREKRVAMAAVALQDGRVFCFGGFDGTSRLSTVEFCCLQRSWRETKSVGAAITDEFWKAAAPMRSARSKLAGAYFRGKIIIIGGYNRKGGLNSVDMFSLPDADRPLGEWTGLSDMQQPRHLCFLLVCNERLFALGGEEDSQNTIEEFSSEDPLPPVDSDLTTWTWIENRRASKLNGIRGAATVIL